MIRVFLLIASLLALAAAAPAPASRDSLGADWGAQQDEARAAVRQGKLIPLGRAIDIVRHRSPGRQLDAGLEQWNGKPVYRIRWVGPHGRRVDYIVDAVSGAILAAN
jgi:uncharacterized membrane protein YkoI